MSSNGNWKRIILERIHFPGTIILDKQDHTYTCGRAADSEIKCLSLTISRHHCIFFRSKDEVYVTDLKSSNGLFINGIAQQPLQTTKLHPNDIIGIGCPDVNSKDDSMFVYKLCIIEKIQAVESNHTISALSETIVLNVENVCNNQSEGIVKRKREQTNHDTNTLPTKVPKLENENYILKTNSLDEKCKPKDENDIEIIHVSLNNGCKHVNANIFESSNTKKNAKCESLIDCKAEFHDITEVSIVSKNNIESVTNMFQEVEKIPENNLLHAQDVQNAINNIYNCESTNTTKNNNVKAEINLKDMDCDPKQSIQNCSEINNAVNEVNFVVENNKEINSFSPLPNFVRNEDGIIKLEDELQLTDTDEDAILNSLNENSVPVVSPLKLKKVKQEMKTTFSEDDVVKLSDSEDDIFPCSQLFDIGFGTNTPVKNEIKEEPIEMESERFNILDDEDLVISLTDSEDEDNNWLHRLSRSQILNGNDEIDTEKKNDIEKEKIDVEIIDRKDPLVNKSHLTKNTEIDMEEKKEAKKSMNQAEEVLPKGVKNLNKILSSKVLVEKIKINSANHTEKAKEISREIDDTRKHALSLKNHILLPMPEKETENSIDTSSSKTEKTISLKKKKKSLEKKVPQIEPPHLPNRKRSSSSTRAQKVTERSEKSTKPSKQKLSAKEQKEQQDKLKLEQYLHVKDKKHRKMLHKWADCLPPNKLGKVVSISKEEKKALADSRKTKLKKLAMEEKQLALEKSQEKKRVVSKPKAKITTKTRNDFLVEETICASSRPASNVPSNVKTAKSRKEKDASTENITHMLSNISSLGRIPKKSSATNVNVAVAEEALKDLSLEKKTEKAVVSKDVVESKTNKDIEKVPPASLKSSLKSPVAKAKKRVSFSLVIQSVREYEIDESNVMKKLSGKDAPIPREKAAVTKKNTTESNAKYNEFLLHIFSWNPIWLEEQQYLNTVAPVINMDKLSVMLTHYRSYDEYYKVIAPLLLLEIWYGITKEFQSIDYRRPTFMCSIVENSVQINMVSQNVFFTTMMLEVLATKDDIHKQIHPVYGDLVFFEYAYGHGGGQAFRKVFAFVTNVYKTGLTPLTRFNKDLQHYVKDPCTLLTYTMVTRTLDKNILVNRVQRLRVVTYLRPNLRMVRALQYLPSSPLVNMILNPKFEMYKLPNITESEALLITNDKLNQKQMEAVCKVTKTVVQKDTKLCFIQGPPGTGKSKVIVNIVTQILYGNNRYTSNGSSFKILVCTPSNAAIDEIVLRLLNIRSTIKNKAEVKPFKMVRIGRSETMHSTVRNISVTELAKRHIKKTTTSSTNISPESIENEKAFLDSKMNAIKCELATSNNVDEIYKQHLKMKLADMAVKYELLKNPKPLNEINDKERMKLQRDAENSILEHADIITCTLTSCCTNQMESIFGTNRKRISVCIVDEATQSCEAETLIPLMLGINILVLVGDPNQLPATILSPEAKKLGLDQSIFSRVQNAFDFRPNNPIIMLDTQYRMQHDIAYWPNKFFYGGKLKNAVESSNKFPFHSYRILNVNTNQNNDNFSNNDEAEFVANIIYCMLTLSNLDSWKPCISCGILTPYNNQKSIILNKIDEKVSSLSDNIKKKLEIDVNTVDGFQGQERDVIIMSCVRSEKIGFLSDKQRLCVALTRAKHSLLMCGNFNIFMRDPMWNSLLTDAKSRKVFFNVSPKADPHEIKSYVIS